MLNKIWADLSTGGTIAEYHAQKCFRPTVVAVVRNEGGGFLVGDHPKSGSTFFLQGGIEDGESLTGAFGRELQEEAGARRVNFSGLLFSREIPYLPGREVRDGFTEGKVYFVCHGIAHRRDCRTVNPGELTNVRWVDLSTLLTLCQSRMEPDKAGLIYATLEKLGYQIGSWELCEKRERREKESSLRAQ